MRKKGWSDKDKEFLLENAGKLSLSELAEYLKRTPKAVKVRISLLGLSSRLETRSGFICKNCNQEFEALVSEQRKFCSRSCSVSYNNKLIKRSVYKTFQCKNCGKETKNKKFCSIHCSSSFRRRENYKNFLENPEYYCGKEKNLSSFKKFILLEQNYRCSICEMLNFWNGKGLVFVLDHIDGNPLNNLRDNLRLICPNCDSQLETFKARNKGKGRFSRRNRFQEGKSF